MVLKYLSVNRNTPEIPDFISVLGSTCEKEHISRVKLMVSGSCRIRVFFRTISLPLWS